MNRRRGTRMSRCRVRGAATGAVPALTSIDITAGTQWDGATAITATGTNFTALTTVSVAAVACATVFVNATTLTFTIPAAETASSPLQTSGAKSVTISNGTGTATFTVGAWDFSTPGNLTWLLDATLTNFTIGTGVATWADTGGNAADATQGTGANQPASGTVAALNSKNAATFDSTNDFMVTTSPKTLDTIITGTAGTVICAFVATDVTGADRVTGYDNDSPWAESAGILGLRLLNDAGTVTMMGMHTQNGGAVKLTSELGITLGTACVATWRHDGTNLALRKNLGTAVTVACGDCTSSVFTTRTMRLGRAHSTATFYFGGSIGHIVAWNISLASADRDRAARKLMVYYGV